MQKRFTILMCLCLMASMAFCQLSTSRHHFFSKARKPGVVVNKKYNLISDSAFLTYEIMAGNMNAWTGDVYNQYPSVQFLCSFDNNKNVETGIFTCLPYTVFNGLNTAGADIFVSYKLWKKLYAIFDIYTFLGYHADLVNEMGYASGIYNLYTLRLQYDIRNNISFFTGYSILNDKELLQQSVFTEVDYLVTKNIPLVLGYASETNISNLNANNIYAGIGVKSILLNKEGYNVKLLTTLNPLYFEHLANIWPITVMFSTEF